MPQYQSFPGASGDSRTLDKRKALAWPDLSGKSFLDVACNEGFLLRLCALPRCLAVGWHGLFGTVQRARAQQVSGLPHDLYEFMLRVVDHERGGEGSEHGVEVMGGDAADALSAPFALAGALISDVEALQDDAGIVEVGGGKGT